MKSPPLDLTWQEDMLGIDYPDGTYCIGLYGCGMDRIEGYIRRRGREGVWSHKGSRVLGDPTEISRQSIEETRRSTVGRNQDPVLSP